MMADIVKRSGKCAVLGKSPHRSLANRKQSINCIETEISSLKMLPGLSLPEEGRGPEFPNQICSTSVPTPWARPTL